MGASSPAKKDNNPCANSLLISFTRIKEFRNIFDSEPANRLSKIFYSLCRNENEVEKYVEDFNNLVKDKNGPNSRLNLNQLLDFILNMLNEELNENNHRDRKNHYREYAERFNEMTNSKIERLFFGSKELKKTCENCKNLDYNYEIFSNLSFDLTNIESDVDLRYLLTEKKEKKICGNCNKEQNFNVEIKYLNLPEIFILYFNCKEFKNRINYYKNIKIKNESFNLIGFIMKNDERNENVKDCNVFFEENKKWYIYKVADNLRLEINEITEIKGNPIIVFYQRNRKFYDNIYNETINLLKDQDNIKDLINEHLVADDDYEKYYLVNKNWYNKIIKILEDETNYSNEGFINTEEKIKNTLKMKNVDLIMKYRLFSERKNKLKDLEKVEMAFEKNMEVNFPKNFLLVKEDVLNKFYKLIYSSIFSEKYLYEVKLGENYIFIKDKNKENYNETIFVCYFNKNDNTIEVECILQYFKPCFNEEIEKYISNRGGIEYFFSKKQLNTNEGEIQIIIDTKTKRNIGNLINIKNPNNHFDLGRFDLEKKIENGNVNNEPGIPIKMSMFEPDKKLDTKVYLTQNNINYKNFNQNNNDNMFS